MTEFELLRSRRRTLAIEVTADGRVLVRAPMRLSRTVIDRFVAEKQPWIEEKLALQQQRSRRRPEPTADKIERLRREAKRILPQRVAHYSAIMGLQPTGIKITSARRRFGSCSAKNSLCFSLYLMQYPMEAIDYVVVHELAHVRHKHHQSEFYDLVATVLPDWKVRRNLLKE